MVKTLSAIEEAVGMPTESGLMESVNKWTRCSHSQCPLTSLDVAIHNVH